eukprot:TRINITY_DN866_c0_g1_i5.p1 TRINITY_DN866_c0_g1~~TRINITY_DN866_c0_g1_i5.p1  ORF type:complete len:464 (-),score=115.89 TRINITY_DN866_c0_g1_i5:164-1555(-)
MMLKLLLLSVTAAVTFASGPPPFFQKANTARWLAHKLNYGVLSTTSASSTLDSAPFGNPQSFSDGPATNSTGRLYFYVSTLDQSMQDIAANPKCSLSLSLQMLDDYCTKEWAPISKEIDPEDPRCTRLTILGTMRNVTAEELPFANASLMARHPAMAAWPASHDFHITTIDIEDLWLINMFGGAALIKPSDYFAAKAPTDLEMGVTTPTPVQTTPPPYQEKAQTARWMAHNLTYGVMSTASVQYPGYAFGNPQSFVDGSVENGTGVLYFYVSQLDASMRDAAVNSQASFTLTEEFANGMCSSGQVDPEDPRCARLVFTGKIRNTTGAEEASGKANLFARHPGMKKWPSDHNWNIVTLDLSHIWLIDFFGGASHISPADYFAAGSGQLVTQLSDPPSTYCQKDPSKSPPYYCHAPPLPSSCKVDKDCVTPWYNSFCMNDPSKTAPYECKLELPPTCTTDKDCVR